MVSSKLSALQQEFLDACFSEPSAFFLTGGAALGGYHLGHRLTDDLDLFSPGPDMILVMSNTLDRAFGALLIALGLRVAIER